MHEAAKSVEKRPEIDVKVTYFLLLVVHAKVSCVGYPFWQHNFSDVLTSSEEDFEFVRAFL